MRVFSLHVAVILYINAILFLFFTILITSVVKFMTVFGFFNMHIYLNYSI